MKKGIVILLAVMLVFAMAVPAAAQNTYLTVDGTITYPGHTVFLQVSLTGPVTGDTMGITYSYDSFVLEIIPESCKWEKAGILQDFSEVDTAGVWAVNQAADLSGLVCTLAFRVLPDANPIDTTVSCTLLVKNGTKDVGTFTAEATVSINCPHQYGQWESSSSTLHMRTCTLCGDTQSQSHSWDSGKRQVRENESQDLMVYSCDICGGTKQHEVPKQNDTTNGAEEEAPGNDQLPGDSTNTGPSQQGGVFVPDQSNNSSTNQSGSQNQNQNGNNSNQSSNDYYSNQSGSNSNQNSFGDNSASNQSGNNYQNQSSGSIYVPTVPNVENLPTTGAEESHEGHDHGDDSSAETETEDLHAGHNHTEVVFQPATSKGTWLDVVLGIGISVGLLAALCVVVLRKKR